MHRFSLNDYENLVLDDFVDWSGKLFYSDTTIENEETSLGKHPVNKLLAGSALFGIMESNEPIEIDLDDCYDFSDQVFAENYNDEFQQVA